MHQTKVSGHLTALFTILIWGTTFISTKLLLVDFSPVEILFFRFLIGFAALWLFYPRRLKLQNRRQELYFVGAGLCGVTLYFLFENIALTYSPASNIGIIVSVAPFFTAILARLFLDGEKPGIMFYLGFVLAIAGIVFISLQSTNELHLNPVGDVLAVLAAFVWAVYSIIVRKIGAFHYNTIATTRRTFFYGLVFMVPALFFLDFRFDISRFQNGSHLFNILFLGFGASAICFVSWNIAVKKLGAVKTSVYIYLVPVVTVITAFLVLHEQITLMMGIGMALTLLGLFLSEWRPRKKERRLCAEAPSLEQ